MLMLRNSNEGGFEEEGRFGVNHNLFVCDLIKGFRSFGLDHNEEIVKWQSVVTFSRTAFHMLG